MALTAACSGSVSSDSFSQKTTDPRLIPGILAKVDMAVVSFQNDTETVVTDPKWLAALTQLLVSARYKPAPYCFCINYPEVMLLSGGKELATFEVPHGEKLRFSGRLITGDFTVGKESGGAILTLTQQQKSSAQPASHAIPRSVRPPKKVELIP